MNAPVIRIPILTGQRVFIAKLMGIVVLVLIPPGLDV
jgi:hypothetical protein